MKCVAIFLVWLTSALNAATFSFGLLPSGGSISGAAGSAIGWGYSITNNSPDQWLVTSDLSSDPFVSVTPSVLFDFPILAPGATVTRSFDLGTGTGLMELILGSSIANPVINTGQFELGAQWWDGDPFAGGAYLADADPVTQSYQATASPAAVPEPSGAMLTLLGCASLGVIRLKQSWGRLAQR